MTRITVGTFNLNNLFSRYNFKGEIDAIQDNDTTVGGNLKYEFGPESRYKIRTYRGKLVKEKDEAETRLIADRIISINVDVLAVQEAEDIDTLRQFNRDELDKLYPHVVLIEGNDPRLIDIGLLSKLPIGGITSWQQSVHPDDSTQTVFGRDLLEVEILDETRSEHLFTLFNNHLKSHYTDYRVDEVVAEANNNERRRKQAEIIAEIVKARTKSEGKYIILGDMNDPPDSPYLSPFVGDPYLNLKNGLLDPQETRPAKDDDPPPPSSAWTHRYKVSGQPANYELYDQIWLSAALSDNQVDSWIDRRTKHGGDGSDHDPAWVTLDI